MKGLNFVPVITYVCDVQMSMLSWFTESFPHIKVMWFSYQISPFFLQYNIFLMYLFFFF